MLVNSFIFLFVNMVYSAGPCSVCFGLSYTSLNQSQRSAWLLLWCFWVFGCKLLPFILTVFCFTFCCGGSLAKRVLFGRFTLLLPTCKFLPTVVCWLCALRLRSTVLVLETMSLLLLQITLCNFYGHNTAFVWNIHHV